VSSAIVAEVPTTTRHKPELYISFKIASVTTVVQLHEGVPEIMVELAALHCLPPLLPHRAYATITSSLKTVVLDPARRDDGHMRLDHHDALDPRGGPPELVPKPAALQVSSSSVSIFNETPGVDLSVCSMLIKPSYLLKINLNVLMIGHLSDLVCDMFREFQS
jgi:hypothetical protein